MNNEKYGGPQVSRQKKKAPGKKEGQGKRRKLAVKDKCSRQKRNRSRQKKIYSR